MDPEEPSEVPDSFICSVVKWIAYPLATILLIGLAVELAKIFIERFL